MEKVAKLTNLYVATLRAIYLLEQTGHWRTRGISFYGKHLLFERIYQAAAKDADIAAERFIGVFGEECVDYSAQCEYINKLLTKYSSVSDCPLEISLAIEEDFLAFSQQVYDALEKEGILTLGLDDMIMSLCASSEDRCYLLQQALADDKDTR